MIGRENGLIHGERNGGQLVYYLKTSSTFGSPPSSLPCGRIWTSLMKDRLLFAENITLVLSPKLESVKLK